MSERHRNLLSGLLQELEEMQWLRVAEVKC